MRTGGQNEPGDATTAARLPGELLLKYRKRSGWNQATLAQMVGLERARSIRNWETGANLPRPHHLMRLIEVYTRKDIFLTDQARQEARQLWNSVKDLFDATTTKLDTYPVFDEGWFERLREDRAPTDATLDVVPTLQLTSVSLPLELNTFIGRADEIATIRRALANTRLLTLTGIGGIGKTRLLLHVGHAMTNELADGVWLADFTTISDSTHVERRVATGLGVVEVTGKPLLNTIVAFLMPKIGLLLLDNCEHVLAGCVTLTTTILRRCSGIKILATSREALEVAGEVIWNVPLLAVPDVGQTIQRLRDVDAVQFFVARAAQFVPDFHLTDDTAPAIIQICRQLDGLPLGLELAAARLRLLSVEQIAERLSGALQLLTGGYQTNDPRHRTLRALLDWSYDPLSVGEKTLLQRLSVFTGSFNLNAVEAVCADDAETDVAVGDVPDMLNVLSALVGKSLVMVDRTATTTHYRLLETIRQYALEKLEQRGQERVWQRAYSYYIEIGDNARALSVTDAYLAYTNARRSVAYLPQTYQSQLYGVEALVKRLSVTTHSTELQQTYAALQEAETTVQRLLDEMETPHARLMLAYVQYWRGHSAYLNWEYDESIAAQQRALTNIPQDSASDLRSRVTGFMARVLSLRGCYTDALPLFYQAVDALEKNRNWTDWIRVATDFSSSLVHVGRQAEAETVLERVEAQALGLQDSTLQGRVYLYRASNAFSERDPVKALRAARSGIAVLNGTEEWTNLTLIHLVCAWAEGSLGDSAAARQSVAEANKIIASGVLIAAADIVLLMRAEVALILGDTQETMIWAKDAIRAAEKIGGQKNLQRAHVVLAQALVRSDLTRKEEAETHLHIALEGAKKGGALLYTAWIEEVWGDMCVAWGDTVAARTHYVIAADLRTQMGYAVKAKQIIAKIV